MFLLVCVILFTGGGCASLHAGIPPHPTPWEQSPPPGADTPLGADTPRSRHPPDTPQHTVNEQPVRILLECILVYHFCTEEKHPWTYLVILKRHCLSTSQKKAGWPWHRENREFGSYFFQTGKTQGILF